MKWQNSYPRSMYKVRSWNWQPNFECLDCKSTFYTSKDLQHHRHNNLCPQRKMK